jgi:hypothetical protein
MLTRCHDKARTKIIHNPKLSKGHRHQNQWIWQMRKFADNFAMGISKIAMEDDQAKKCINDRCNRGSGFVRNPLSLPHQRQMQGVSKSLTSSVARRGNATWNSLKPIDVVG